MGKAEIQRQMMELPEEERIEIAEAIWASLENPDSVPMTGAEIVRSGSTGGWAHKNIDNGEEWVQEQRRQRREARGRR